MISPHGKRLAEVLRNNGFGTAPYRFRGAEIGVRHGDMAEYMLKEFPGLSLMLVDPYLPYTGTEKATFTQERQTEIKEAAHARLYPWTPQVKWVYKTSVKAAVGILDRQYDYVFIDACHTFESVREDLLAWYPKVMRHPGILAGHDWNMDGVQKAVRGFADYMGLHVHYDAADNVSTWWIIL